MVLYDEGRGKGGQSLRTCAWSLFSISILCKLLNLEKIQVKAIKSKTSLMKFNRTVHHSSNDNTYVLKHYVSWKFYF